MMKTVLIIIGAILLIGAVGVIVVTILDREVRKTVISEVDLARLPDGVYSGSFHSGRWHNEVEVTVKDHKIVSIKNINELPDKRAAGIVDEAIAAMLAKQSLKIDVISGASLNTRSFQRAVENALKEGITK